MASSSAILAGMTAPAVLDAEAAKDLMRQVATRFNFMPAIADFLVEQGVRSLSDFQNIITSKEAVGPMITDRMAEETRWEGSKMVQTARVRMAWESTFTATEAERKKAAAFQDNAEDLLPEEELTNLEQK